MVFVTSGLNLGCQCFLSVWSFKYLVSGFMFRIVYIYDTWSSLQVILILDVSVSLLCGLYDLVT
mgnify:CR=1 FL=1